MLLNTFIITVAGGREVQAPHRRNRQDHFAPSGSLGTLGPRRKCAPPPV